MTSAIRAELRKLLTVRSTYFVLIGAVLLNAVISFWASGYKAGATLPGDYLQGCIQATMNAMAFFAGIAPLLLVTHEYRHNTIYYTLTANRSRTTVFLAKLIVIAKYVLTFMLITALVTVAAVLVGIKLGGHTLQPQHFDWWPLVWRSTFFMLGVSYLAAIFGFIIRNQIGSFVAYLLYPGTVESLLAMLLKSKAGYLPFTSLSNVMHPVSQDFSIAKSAVIGAVWVVAGLVVSWLLFVRRDAN